MINSTYNDRKELFLENICVHNMHGLISISRTENPYLYPLHTIYLSKMSEYGEGIFIADVKGIYTPIDHGGYGVVHVERLPLSKPGVYALTDLCKSVYISIGSQTIIYVGVIKTEYGYMPISNDSYIKPVSGLTFSNPSRLLTTRNGLVVVDDKTDEEEEEEYMS